MIYNANIVYPDQTPLFAASDLGLHCLPVSFWWDARHVRVNAFAIFYRPVNNIKVMLSRSFNLHTFFLDRISPLSG